MCATHSLHYISVYPCILGEHKCQTRLSCFHHLAFVMWKKIVTDIRKSSDKEMSIMSSQSLRCFLFPLWCSTPLLTLPTHSAVRLPWCYWLWYLKNNHGFKVDGLRISQRVSSNTSSPGRVFFSVHTYVGSALLQHLGTKSKQSQ